MLKLICKPSFTLSYHFLPCICYCISECIFLQLLSCFVTWIVLIVFHSLPFSLFPSYSKQITVIVISFITITWLWIPREVVTYSLVCLWFFFLQLALRGHRLGYFVSLIYGMGGSRPSRNSIVRSLALFRSCLRVSFLSYFILLFSGISGPHSPC